MAAASRPRHRSAVRGLLAAVALITAASPWTLVPAVAQQLPWVGVPPRVPGSSGTSFSILSPSKRDPNAQMLVQADELQYDYKRERVSAVGSVRLQYEGSVVEADRVSYVQRTKQLFASGRVRVTEPDGKVIEAERISLDENFRNGFVQSLRVETREKVTLAAARADVRSRRGQQDTRLTVFQSGVYTACETCIEEPQRPPKWQIRAARIIHSQVEKTIYFEDAAFELYGVPIAYFPYFWTPDPTVDKKTGLLAPRLLNGTYFGNALEVPVFFNLAPDYDLTLAPIFTSKQGNIYTGEFRQRLTNGAYAVRATGISQNDKELFLGTTGYRDFRGSIETKGDFRLAQNWYYGWDASIFTDNSYSPQYKVTPVGSEALSQFYLFGRGPNSYFDARAVHIYGLTPLDVQKQLPVLHPVIDYKYKFAQPVWGGELKYTVNFTSLSRQQADFDPINSAAAEPLQPNNTYFNDFLNVCDSRDPAAVKTRANCLLRGVPGTYTRLSSDVTWSRKTIDAYGQIFTPFLWARGDVGAVSVTQDQSIANFITPGDSSAVRVMPAVGIDYRYPLIRPESWGTQIIEPRAQIIARPGERQVGNRFPNEDSQSLLFDDVNLFAISKFPGWDRVEGGGRANVAMQYTAQFNNNGYFNALFGQSYQLFGPNSYAAGDASNAGLDSGLETQRSDYVARATFKPNTIYTLTSRVRLDEQTFERRRLEVENRVTFDRWTAAVTYGQYDAQPNIGLLMPRESVSPSGSLKLSPNFSMNALAIYSVDSARLNTVQFGINYLDECIALGATFVENFGFRGDIVPNRVFLFSFALRTLGGSTVSQQVGGVGSGASGLAF